MLLCVDIGNSWTKLALYQEGLRVHVHRYPTMHNYRATLYDAATSGGRHGSPFADAPVEEIAISGVVPDLYGIVRRGFRHAWGVKARFVGKELLPSFPIRYGTPETLGADRMANAAAAIALCGAPVVVVDCGTATNIDVVAPDGAFIGGAIMPGPEAASEALYGRARHLPEVEIRKPARVIGGSSEECMESGLYFGLVSQLEGMVRRTLAELGAEAPVIGTGGWSGVLLQDQPWVDRVEPTLTLDGVYRIWEANRDQARNLNRNS